MILLKTRKKNKKLTDSITEKKQVKFFGKESSVFVRHGGLRPKRRKNPFSKGFVSVRARREGKNKLDVFLRVLRFFVVKKVSVPPCLSERIMDLEF